MKLRRMAVARAILRSTFQLKSRVRADTRDRAKEEQSASSTINEYLDSTTS